MKKIYAALITCLGVSGLIAQTSLVAANAVTVKQETAANGSAATDFLTLKESTFDFDKIPQGKPVTHEFEVINAGSDSLRIDNVQASCGCTTPEWEKGKAHAPGAKTKIVVGYNAASEGAFTKEITITYNGSFSKQIHIKGEVWKTPVTSAPENKALEF